MLAERAPDRVLSFVNIEGNLALEDCFLSRQIIGNPDEDPAVFLEEFAARTHPAPEFSSALYASRVRSKVRPDVVRGVFESMVDLSDHGNLLSRFTALAMPRLFMYGEQNAGLSYLPLLREHGVERRRSPGAGTGRCTPIPSQCGRRSLASTTYISTGAESAPSQLAGGVGGQPTHDVQGDAGAAVVDKPFGSVSRRTCRSNVSDRTRVDCFLLRNQCLASDDGQRRPPARKRAALDDPRGVGVAGGHDALDGGELDVVPGSVDLHKAGGEAGAGPRCMRPQPRATRSAARSAGRARCSEPSYDGCRCAIGLARARVGTTDL